MYSVLQAARASGVSSSTIRNWSSEFSEFLSPGANPAPGATREFSDDDLKVFSTVRVMRGQLVETVAIVEALREGQRFEPVAPPAAEGAPPADRANADAVMVYRDLVTQLESRADKLTDRLLEAERRIADERERRAAAERELAILRELYEASTAPQEPDRPVTFWEWVTGRRRK